MKLCILYHPQSDHARIVEDFARDFGRSQPDREANLVSLDTQEGATMAKLYDIVQYPALVALTDDGQVQKIWEGEQLPLIDEVASYTSN